MPSTVTLCRVESIPISNDPTFSDCVVLEKEAFDPDAVFLDDIVDDEVLPKLSLAVDGLTESGSRSQSDLELHSEDAANDDTPVSSVLPETPLDPEQLEVYGWESSFWRKILTYFKF